MTDATETRLAIGETVTVDGFKLRADIQGDCCQREPWTEEDGHGPVSGWERRDKAPGELVLCNDRGRSRFYDFAAACKLALAEGWDAKPYNTGQETKRQQAAKAALADFERLRSWCNDGWNYVGVLVTASRDGIELGSASLWGIESDAGDYLDEVATELVDDALTDARTTLESLCRCAA